MLLRLYTLTEDLKLVCAFIEPNYEKKYFKEKLVFKGIVQGRITGFLFDIERYIFVCCLDAYIFFTCKGTPFFEFNKTSLSI
jgi:hypothetical protein